MALSSRASLQFPSSRARLKHQPLRRARKVLNCITSIRIDRIKWRSTYGRSLVGALRARGGAMLGLPTFADAFFRGTRMSYCHVWTMALHCYCTYRFGSSIQIANVRASREFCNISDTSGIAHGCFQHLSAHQGLTAPASCRNDATCRRAKTIFTRKDEQNASWFGVHNTAPLMSAGGTDRLSTKLGTSTNKDCLDH